VQPCEPQIRKWSTINFSRSSPSARIPHAIGTVLASSKYSWHNLHITCVHFWSSSLYRMFLTLEIVSLYNQVQFHTLVKQVDDNWLNGTSTSVSHWLGLSITNCNNVRTNTRFHFTDLWPLTGSDLNPSIYKIWGCLQDTYARNQCATWLNWSSTCDALGWLWTNHCHCWQSDIVTVCSYNFILIFV